MAEQHWYGTVSRDAVVDVDMSGPLRDPRPVSAPEPSTSKPASRSAADVRQLLAKNGWVAEGDFWHDPDTRTYYPARTAALMQLYRNSVRLGLEWKPDESAIDVDQALAAPMYG